MKWDFIKKYDKNTKHPTLNQLLVTLVNNISLDLQPSPIVKLKYWSKFKYSILNELKDEKTCQSQENTW